MKHIKKFETINYSLIDAICDSTKIDTIIKMIDNGADVNEVGFLERSPLIYSTIYIPDSVNVLKKLIEKGARIDYTDEDGRTALIMAALRSNLKSVYALIENGADWNIVDRYGDDFLYLLGLIKSDTIKMKYPEKYKEYLIKKESEKYNL